MSLSILEFWKLAIASGLLSPARCQQLHASFVQLKGAPSQANLATLTQWLVAEKVLTRYQAAALAAGHAGPFVLGDYTIRDRIESGRFAYLFHARSHDNKVLLALVNELVDDNTSEADVVAAAIAASRADSPHVSQVRVIDSEPMALVMPELSGHTLRELLASKKPGLKTACQIGFQTALGLVAVHATQSAHGGVWPDNLWIDSSGTIKLLQYPLVPLADHVVGEQQPAANYRAPELFAGEPASPMTDVYALGCTLFELIAGHVPFGGAGLAKIRARHEAEVPPRLDRLRGEVPEELADLVAEMLDKEPMLRTQSAHQVAYLLSRFVSSSKGRGDSPPRIDNAGPAVGFGAWQAPSWEAPPQLVVNPEATPGIAPPKEPLPVATTAEPIAPKSPTSTSDAGPIWPGVTTGSKRSLPAAPIVVTQVEGAPSARTARKHCMSGVWIAVGGVLLFALASLLVVLATRGPAASSAPQVQPSAPPRPAVSSNASGEVDVEPAAPEAVAALSVIEVNDDGQSLWRAPTDGQPLALDYLPSGTQALLAVRPSELLATSEGSRMLAALGENGQSMLLALRERLGMPLESIAQLTIAFTGEESAGVQTAYVIELLEAANVDSLVGAWGRPTMAEHKGHSYWQAMQLAYWMPEPAGGRTVVIAPRAVMVDVIERGGPALVRSALEQLLRKSDAGRQLTVVWAPSFLAAEGKELLAGPLESLREPLAGRTGESTEGVLLSGHLSGAESDERLYLELRAIAAPPKRPLELAQLLRERLATLPADVQRGVAPLTETPYAQAVLRRFPEMLRRLDAQVRAGVDDRQSVLNAYLPGSAAHNLILASQLALTLPRGAGPPDANRPAALAETPGVLERRISLSFPREALDRCLEEVSASLNVRIEILGPDLQLEGITKNQMINGLDERDQSAGVVLRRVLKLANPEGKLVYLVRHTPEGETVISITTRAAASKRGDRLPAEFVEKSPDDSR